MENIIIKYILDAVFAAIPAVGFAMVFNVPKFALKFCALGGAIVYTLRTYFFRFWYIYRNIYIPSNTFIWYSCCLLVKKIYSTKTYLYSCCYYSIDTWNIRF